MLQPEISQQLQQGVVIPAHPLALTAQRQLDEKRQRLLTRYYLAAGAGGVAVGVHTTQFAIRDPRVGLFRPVLELAMEELKQTNHPVIKIAGVSGAMEQVLGEAALAKDLGYDLALLSMNGLMDWSEDQLLERARAVGEVLPIFGFYLQPAVGGRVLSPAFWQAFAEIPQVHAIKIAPFNRYQTLDVVRAVCLSSRREEIALYTGNDDNIWVDLLTPFRVKVGQWVYEKPIVGGLLGHWAVWTHAAVQQFNALRTMREKGAPVSMQWLSQAMAVTDANAAFFDAANNFKGCIAGIHEVLRRQGLLEGIWCLDPEEGLSPGQAEAIDRVYQEYPSLHDDDFVKEFLNKYA